MKLIDLYKVAVEIGMENDPRGKDEINRILEEEKKKYEGLSDKEKKFFDKERLNHPYADTRILSGDEDNEIKKVFVGIDIDTQEVLLVNELKRMGEDVDGIISHHPSGRAWASFYDVMDMQVDILEDLSVNPVVAEKLLSERKGEVMRRVIGGNHYRGVSSAQILGINWVCIHTPADNCVYQFLKKYFEDSKPKYLSDVMDLLYDIPEYQEAAKRGTPPVILLGSKKSRVGRIALEMTGGTEPSVENYSILAQKGVGTIVGMHFSEKHYQKAREAKLNLIVAGHMSSDTLGLNLLLDEVEKRVGSLCVVSGSGFYRVKR